MSSLKGISSLVLAGSFLFFSPLTHAQGKGDLECHYLTAIEGGFLANHIRYSNRDASLANHTIEQYLKRIDPSKIYLLTADVEQIKSWMSGLFEKTKNKDCTFLTETQKLLVKRAEERAEFAKKFLGKDYKFDPKTEFTFDPDKKPFPKDTNEANDFMKKYIHFQIANYQATDMKMDEAKKNVIKSYERAVKRLQDTKVTDLYSDYLDSFARALDPHSSFFSRDSLEDFEIQMRLSLEGIGATLSSQDGFTVVEQLVPGGAAAK